MTREEAIIDLKAKITRIKSILDDGLCANPDRWAIKLKWHEDMLSALHSPWVSLDEQLPVKSDSLYCSVLVWGQYGAELINFHQLYSTSTLAKYTHFLPIPPLPEVEP